MCDMADRAVNVRELNGAVDNLLNIIHELRKRISALEEITKKEKE